MKRTTEYTEHTEKELFRVFRVFRGEEEHLFLMIWDEEKGRE